MKKSSRYSMRNTRNTTGKNDCIFCKGSGIEFRILPIKKPIVKLICRCLLEDVDPVILELSNYNNNYYSEA